MRPILSAAALLSILLAVTPAPCKASHSTAYEIGGPTVIAFFPSAGKNADNADTNEALSDFQLYTASAQQLLRAEKVEFQTVYTRSFEVVQDGRLVKFRPPKSAPGYYFAMPGRKPRVEYGVMSDKDIERIAQEYFGGAMKQ
ncbi:MAG TPA: hypothetical protein VFW25_14100 [Silvibacterium sp.]|nr:hypothetical protein [Silvibacterium sp.]